MNAGGLRVGHAVAVGVLILLLVFGIIALTVGPELLPAGSVARSPAVPAIGPGVAADDEQQREIVAALLAGPMPLGNRLRQPMSAERMVLRNTTAALCDQSDEEFGFVRECDTSSNGPLPLAFPLDPLFRPLREAMLAANAQPQPQPDPRIPGLRIAPNEEDPAAWLESRASFEARYPGATIVVRLSRAVVSADGRHAQILHAYSCGKWDCGQGTVVRFVREGGKWRIDATEQLWIS